MAKAGKPSTGRRKRVDRDEQDAFSMYGRRWYHWRGGALRIIKRRNNKRSRRQPVGVDEICCICACQHQHRTNDLVDGAGQCVMCKWCMCTASEHTGLPD
jgi:hypothetical protein